MNCKVCGSKLADGAAMCELCGSLQTDVVSNNNANYQQMINQPVMQSPNMTTRENNNKKNVSILSKKSTLIMVALVGVIFLLIILICTFYIGFHKDKLSDDDRRMKENNNFSIEKNMEVTTQEPVDINEKDEKDDGENYNGQGLAENSVNDKQVHYRVRKSVNDAQTQIGAFNNFENAKRLAESRKNDGYKVYDMEANYIYSIVFLQ